MALPGAAPKPVLLCSFVIVIVILILIVIVILTAQSPLPEGQRRLSLNNCG